MQRLNNPLLFACLICSQTLPGNWNYYQVKRNVFHYAFTAKHIRLLPLAWNTEDGGKIGVRLELFGCSYGKNDRWALNRDLLPLIQNWGHSAITVLNHI